MVRPRRRVAREALVPSLGSKRGLFPRSSIAPGGDYGRGLSSGDGRVAGPGVVGPIGCDEANGLLGRDLRQELRQHRPVSDPTAGDLDSPDLHRVRVDAQMDFAP